MSCVELEQLMANNSELNHLVMSVNTEIHPNNFDGQDGNFEFDVSVSEFILL